MEMKHFHTQSITSVSERSVSCNAKHGSKAQNMQIKQM